jgi:hypothetical protein
MTKESTLKESLLAAIVWSALDAWPALCTSRGTEAA